MPYKGKYPERIVCLTEETTELLCLLGEEDRIVGISQYTVRPSGIQNRKPVVCRYIDADVEAIEAVKPDVVFAWSNLQAEICKELITKGIEVYCFNHRGISGVLDLTLKVGGILGIPEKAEALHIEFSEKLDDFAQLSNSTDIAEKPRVYFEEWPKPIITSIRYVNEAIGLAGGINLFAKYSESHSAGGRIIEDDNQIINSNPDIILASWCGKPFNKRQLLKRKYWDSITAVKNDFIYELPSDIILQPGPALITEGIPMMAEIFDNWRKSRSV
ncbi:MAG: cobalamin-binding protein [Candidatus Kapaibacteriales bacterium]